MGVSGSGCSALCGSAGMKSILKWVGKVAASLAGLVVLAVAWVFIRSQVIHLRSNRTNDRKRSDNTP
jgi:hypothetical protein